VARVAHYKTKDRHDKRLMRGTWQEQMPKMLDEVAKPDVATARRDRAPSNGGGGGHTISSNAAAAAAAAAAIAAMGGGGS